MELDIVNAQGLPGVTLPENLYFESDTVEGKPAMVGTPGSYVVGTLTYGGSTYAYPVQRLLRINRANAYGDTYAVAASNTGLGRAFKSTNGAAFTHITSPATFGAKFVDICNGKLVGISAGHTAFLYVEDTAAPVAMPAVPTAMAVVDGYVIVADQYTRTLRHSTLLAPTTGYAANYAVLVGAADAIAGLYNLNGELWAMGNQTTEVLYNAGGATFQFAALPQGFIATGTRTPLTVAEWNNSLYFMNEKFLPCRTVGYGYEVISSPQVSYYTQRNAFYTSPETCKGFIIVLNGHPMYVLRTVSYTFACDINMLNSYGPNRAWFWWYTGASAGAHFTAGDSSLHEDLYGYKYWILGTTDGRIMGINVPSYMSYMDDCPTTRTPIVSHLYCRAVRNDRKMITHNAFELEIRPTLGTAPTLTQVSATALTADAAAGATTITVAVAGTNWISGNVVVITLADGTTFQTWQSGAAVGTVITLLEPLPGAASSGALATAYSVAGNSSGNTYCPRVELFYQDGYTSGTWVSLGKRRMYIWPANTERATMKVAWYGLGASKDRYYRITIAEGCEKKIFGASLDATVED